MPESAITVPPLKYTWLADVIRSTIERNKFADNELLPSERELAEQYEVSRDTVRKTIRLLEEQGVIYNAHGRGTFVAPEIVRRAARSVEGFSEATSSHGGMPSQRVLVVEPIMATMALAGLMGVGVGHPLTRVRRVRLIDQQPVGLHDAYVTAPSIKVADLVRYGSLYALLRHLKIEPVEAIDALSASAANAEEAILLLVETNSPLLMCERITLSDRREPIEYCLMKYVPSYRFSTRFTKRDVVAS